MNGGVLPLALAFMAFALSLGRACRQAAWTALAALLVGLVVGALLPLPSGPGDWQFVGLWLSVIATAALTYLAPQPIGRWQWLATANLGFWCGAVAAASDLLLDLVLLLPLALLFVPANWLARRGYAIVIKVLASWVIAVATLAMFVSLAPTPGYKSDHME